MVQNCTSVKSPLAAEAICCSYFTTQFLAGQTIASVDEEVEESVN
jgi:hypothetical protein